MSIAERLFLFQPLFAVDPDAGSGDDAGAVDASAGAGAPEADLDAIISKVMEGRGIGDDTPAAPDQDASAPAADGRKRAPDGRFTPNSGDAPGDAGSADPATKAAPSEPAQPARTAQSLPVPDNWPAEHKAAFTKLPADGQKFILDRHAEMQGDYTRKTQEIAEFRRNAEPLLQAVNPFTKYIQSLGRSPADAVNVLLGTEYRLRTGTPQEKAHVFAQLAVDYGVAPVDIHNLIQQGRITRPVPLNPQQQQLIQQTNARIEAIERQNADRDREAQGRQASAEIETFRSAKTADGKPKYPHYDAVIGSMSDWLASDPRELAGKSLPQMLDAAYDRFGKPIEAAIKQQVTERQKQATEANASAVSRARNAAPVRSNGSSPRGSATSRDLDAIISSSMTKAGYQG